MAARTSTGATVIPAMQYRDAPAAIDGFAPPSGSSST